MPEPVTPPVPATPQSGAPVVPAVPPVDPKPATPPATTPETPKPATPETPKPQTPETPKPAADLKKEDLTLAKDSPLDPKTVDEILTLAKAKGWDKETAQAVLDRENKLLSSQAESQKASLKQMQDSWVETSKNDKEIGGDDYARNSELAKRVIDRFATPEFKEILAGTGRFGNHPELVRTFVRIGKAMSEDQLVVPSGDKKTPESAADKLYGTVAPKGE